MNTQWSFAWEWTKIWMTWKSCGCAISPGSQLSQSLRRHQLIQSCRNKHQRSKCSSSGWGACRAGLSLALSLWGRTGKGGHSQGQERCYRTLLHPGTLPLGLRDIRTAISPDFEEYWSPIFSLRSRWWLLTHWGLPGSSPWPPWSNRTHTGLHSIAV